MSGEPTSRVLRKLWWPVVGESWIPLCVVLFCIFVGAWKSQPKVLWLAGIIVVLTLAISFFQFAYRVSYSQVAVIQEASGTKRTSIAFSDVGRVALERATVAEMIQGGRPFRRLAIYAKGNGTSVRRIHVSLRHFAGEDIRALLESLRRHRPDLEIPCIDGHYWSPA
jgi:hypothetical protein